MYITRKSVLIYPFPKDPRNLFCRVLFFYYICTMLVKIIGSSMIIIGLGITYYIFKRPTK